LIRVRLRPTTAGVVWFAWMSATLLAQRIYVTGTESTIDMLSVVDVPARSVVATVKMMSGAGKAIFSPDGTRAWIGTGSTEIIVELDTVRNVITRSSTSVHPIGPFSAGGLVRNSRTNRLFVTTRGYGGGTL